MSEGKPRLISGNTAGIGFDIHQNDVRPDLFDAVPGDPEVIMPSGNPQNPAGTRHQNGADIALRDLNLDIGDKAQAAAVGNADDLLALQLGKQ